MRAYNSALNTYEDSSDRKGGASLEETAAKVAWYAVRNEYEKDDQTGEWVKK